MLVYIWPVMTNLIGIQTRVLKYFLEFSKFFSCWRVPSEIMWLLPLSYRSGRSITPGCHLQICTFLKNIIRICHLRWYQLMKFGWLAHGLIGHMNWPQTYAIVWFIILIPCFVLLRMGYWTVTGNVSRGIYIRNISRGVSRR